MNARQIARTVVAAVLIALTGAAVMQTQAEAGAAHARVCLTGSGWKVPARGLALCDAVAGQPAYEFGPSGWPKGTALVTECRADGRSEAREYGRKAGDRYVVSCLYGQHRDWLGAQPRK